MNAKKKEYSLKESAKMLGISEITLRRRIHDGKIKANISSNKQGYKISEDELLRYATSFRLGTLWTGALVAGIVTGNSVARLAVSSSIPIVGGVVGKILESIIKSRSGSSIESIDDVEELNDPEVIKKIIFRLNAEISDFDLQIEHLESKIQDVTSENEKAELQENIFFLKSQKINILKKINEFEIRKAILEKRGTP